MLKIHQKDKVIKNDKKTVPLKYFEFVLGTRNLGLYKSEQIELLWDKLFPISILSVIDFLVLVCFSCKRFGCLGYFLFPGLIKNTHRNYNINK